MYRNIDLSRERFTILRSKIEIKIYSINAFLYEMKESSRKKRRSVLRIEILSVKVHNY